MTRIEQMHTVFFQLSINQLSSVVICPIRVMVCHSDFGTPHHPSSRRMYVREGGGYQSTFTPASFNPVASGDGVVQRGDAQARVHAVAFASQEVVGGEDAFIAYEVSTDGDVGQRGGAVQQGVLGRYGLYRQGHALAADAGIVHRHLGAFTQTDATAIGTVAHEQQVAQVGVSHRFGEIIVTIVVGLDQAVAGITQRTFCFLVSHQVRAPCRSILLSSRRVVAAAHYDHVAHVDRAAEEFKAVVRTPCKPGSGLRRAVAHAIEGDAVGLMFFVEGITVYSTRTYCSVPELSSSTSPP